MKISNYIYESRINNFYNTLREKGAIRNPSANYYGVGSSEEWHREELVKTWKENADHNFFNNLIKIHWFTNTDFLGVIHFLKNAFLDVRDIGSISTVLYDEKKGILDNHSRSAIGVLIEGEVYYAANDQDSVYSGSWGYGIEKLPLSDIFNLFHVNYKSKNKNKYNVILDKHSFINHTKTFNEALVKNWVPYGIVFKDTLGNVIKSRFIRDPKGAKFFFEKMLEKNYLVFFVGQDGKLQQTDITTIIDKYNSHT